MKKLFVISLIVGIFALPALANIYPSSGGKILPGFIDNKAEPVIGSSVGEDGTTILELGGIYTLIPGGGVTAFDVIDITIEHGDGDNDGEDDDIIITWPNVPDGTVPQVVVLIGDGTGLFNNDPTKFVVDSFDPDTDYGKWIMFVDDTTEQVLNINVDSGDPVEWIFFNMAGGQKEGQDVYYKEMYFKVFAVPQAMGIEPAPAPVLTDYTADFIAATAVGKLDYAFGQGNNFFNCPFLTTGDLNFVIGAHNVAMNCQMLEHDRPTDGFIASTFNGTSWVDAYELDLGKGYVFFNSSSAPLILTLAGKVNPDPAAFSKELKIGNTFIGQPFPIKKTLGNLFSDPVMNDSVLIHDKITDGFIAKSCVNDGSFVEPDFELEPSLGYVYYRNSGELDWQPQP